MRRMAQKSVLFPHPTLQTHTHTRTHANALCASALQEGSRTSNKKEETFVDMGADRRSRVASGCEEGEIMKKKHGAL
jgi:hypothetical protein